MVEVPSGLMSLWPRGSGAGIMRAWAGQYGTQYGFTQPRLNEPGAFHNSPEQDAFRHAFVASAIYLEAYNSYRKLGQPPDVADRWATTHRLDRFAPPPEAPSSDAATSDQMRAWARALRLGGATGGIAGGMMPAPDAAPATLDQLIAGAFDPVRQLA